MKVKRAFVIDVFRLLVTSDARTFLQTKIDTPDFFVNMNLTRFNFFEKKNSHILLSKHTDTYNALQALINSPEKQASSAAGPE